MSNLFPVLSATRGRLDTDLGGAPDAHAASHASGGSDPITADDIGALAVTGLNKPVHGLHMDGEVISGVHDPIASDDAATKAYVDTAVSAVPWVLPLCPYATNDGPLAAAGRLRFDPALFARAGLTLVVTLEIVGDVSAGGLTGTAELYDLTAAATAATLSWTETSATAKTAAVTAPGAAHTYELRASLSGGVGYLILGGAVLRLTWS